MGTTENYITPTDKKYTVSEAMDYMKQFDLKVTEKEIKWKRVSDGKQVFITSQTAII